jgi:SAM-dependent methyltransferase
MSEKMLFDWNNDTIRWYTDANAYSGFYKSIAETVRPALEGCKTLCDIGCGLGLFDFEVAPRLETIDCVDISEPALTFVRERAAGLGLGNIRTHLTDCDDLTGRWDAVYMSFFGSRELDRFLHLCKKLIAVVGVTSETEMFPSKDRSFRKNTADNAQRYLDGCGIAYRLTYRTLEFGQPFVSRADAEAFVRAYVPDIPENELNDFLNARLTQTDSADFPLYMPRQKTIGIFELNGALS